MSKLSEQLPRYNVQFDLLPLFHVCDAYNAREHLALGEITTDIECDVFGGRLNYLFYGRPAYKYATETGSTRNLSVYPVAFVLDAESVDSIRRIFPFDTGAMQIGMYKSYFHKKSSNLDFELEPTTSRIKDLVIHMYGTNENYTRFDLADARSSPNSFEMNGLAELFRSLHAQAADERRATIEVQTDNAIVLSPESLIGMIVPLPFMEDPLYKDFAQANNALLEPYEIAVWDPSQCFGLVQNAARLLMTRLAEAP